MSIAAQRLAREMALREGAVPLRLPSPLLETPLFSLSRDAFLLVLPSGLRFHYVRGQSVTFWRPVDIGDAEVALFHASLLYGAVAWLNGFVVLQASAIVHDGQVHAFAGEAGAGKSALAAALTSRGFAFFADEILVLDLANSDRPTALPQPGGLKLGSDALTLTGLEAAEPLRAGLDRYFVAPPLAAQDSTLPMNRLYPLQMASETSPSVKNVDGVDRMRSMYAAFAFPRMFGALTNRLNIFQTANRLARQVSVQTFDRPRARGLFASNVDFLAGYIRELHA